MVGISQIPTPLVSHFWLLVQPLFESVLPHANGDFSLDDIKSRLLSGHSHLVVVRDGLEITGAVAVTYQQRTNRKVAFIAALAGNHVITLDNWTALCDIFRGHGATHIESVFRPAVERLNRRLGIGLTEAYRVYGATL